MGNPAYFRFFLSQKEALIKIEISFFDPIKLEWYIPGGNGADHNNSPGVDVSIPAYIFFKNLDFIDIAYQNSFYMLLKGYEFNNKIHEKQKKMEERGYSVCFYDKNKHYGFEELCEDLGSEDWRWHIFTNLEKPEPDPILIIEHNGRIGGFAGPLRVQESGRGFFAGIGVHTDFRSGGSGSVLFATLCKELKNLGADFMTLFTGELNPARNIYRAAGFKIVKTWADMRKELK